MISAKKYELFARRIIIFLALVLFIGLGCSTVYRSSFSTAHRTDFTVYTAAGKAVLESSNIYDAHNIRGWYYMYLPVFAVAMVPLSLLNTFSASLIWYLLSVVMFAYGLHVSVKLTRRYFQITEQMTFWLYVLGAIIVLPPLLSGLTRGQASVLMMYLATMAVWFYFEKRDGLAGFCLAGSIVLKIFPVLLLAYFLFKRRFKAAIMTCLWLFLLILVVPSGVFGVKGNLILLNQWIRTIAMPTSIQKADVSQNIRYDQMINPRTMRNQSVHAVAIRTASGRVIDIPHENEFLARKIALGVNIGLLLISMAACLKRSGAENSSVPLLQLSVIILLMIFLSPVSWNHNFIILTLPTTVAIGGWISNPHKPKGRVLGIGLLLYVIGNLLVLMDYFNFYGALLWGTLALWAAIIWVLLGVNSIPERNTARIRE